MKVVLNALLEVIKVVCPKSRWGNVIYLILGFGLANFDSIAELFKAIKALF